MPFKVLICPDKFKGTLSAEDAAAAMARGWQKIRPDDVVKLLPMSDGGDGFGEIISRNIGATPQKIKTVNAAHEPVESIWWWEPKSKTAVIESAKVIGLAMFPKGKFHPFDLDTFGLGKVLQAASDRGAKRCFIGIGGSATNDAGFGLARALGWKFLNKNGNEIESWITLHELQQICPPKKRRYFPELIVAVDVKNPLLGKQGCSAIYGPQKGLRSEDIPVADKSLRRLAVITRKDFQHDFAKISGAGAAGGLGFGLMAFVNAVPQSGFDLFARYSNLEKQIRAADLVITGEGAIDQQTLMGKGVGQMAVLCKKFKVPCYGIAGMVTDKERAKKLFRDTCALTEITSLENAKRQPAKFLEKMIANIASLHLR